MTFEWEDITDEIRELFLGEILRRLGEVGEIPRVPLHSETPTILEDEERLRKAQSGQPYDQQE